MHGVVRVKEWWQGVYILCVRLDLSAPSTCRVQAAFVHAPFPTTFFEVLVVAEKSVDTHGRVAASVALS